MPFPMICRTSGIALARGDCLAWEPEEGGTREPGSLGGSPGGDGGAPEGVQSLDYT